MLRLQRSNDNILFPHGPLQSKSPHYLHNVSCRLRNDTLPIHLRPRRSLRTHWCNIGLRISIHPSATLLHETQHAELANLCCWSLRCFWCRRHVHHCCFGTDKACKERRWYADLQMNSQLGGRINWKPPGMKHMFV
jgi:hypothetical protein